MDDYLEVWVDDEMVVEEVDEEPTRVEPLMRHGRDDEPTRPFACEQLELQPDHKLVIGYLTMEEHGMFAGLGIDEQEKVAKTLWQ